MALVSRDEAIATLEEGDTKIGAFVRELSDEQMIEPKTIGGGDWSAKDLLGHLAFWEELALEALEDLRAGRTPRVEDAFVRGAEGVDELNARNQEITAGQSLNEVRARIAAAHTGIIEAIRTMNDEEWNAKVPYKAERRETVGQMLASILGAPKRPFGHAFAHLPDLEAYIGSVKS
jgi:hypothetical protein